MLLMLCLLTFNRVKKAAPNDRSSLLFSDVNLLNDNTFFLYCMR